MEEEIQMINENTMQIRFYTSDSMHLANMNWSRHLDELPQAIHWKERGVFLQCDSDLGAYYQTRKEMTVTDGDFKTDD